MADATRSSSADEDAQEGEQPEPEASTGDGQELREKARPENQRNAQTS
jgi:hypothetical protein